jgi:hypothetical protein
MKQYSENEQALIEIQHDWAKARIKGIAHIPGDSRRKIAQLCGLTAAS